jgi:tryptophan-rich sensory protein
MKSKSFDPKSLLFPFLVILVGIVGSTFTFHGMTWYKEVLIKPAGLTPPDWAFSVAWTLIFIGMAISGMMVWHKTKDRRTLLFMFILNALLNVGWSYLFFELHQVTASFVEMLLLEASTIGLCIMSWKSSKWAGLLLLPYPLWVAFATALTYSIMIAQ